MEISPDSATSSHPDLSLQTILLISSLTSMKPPLPSGVTPISSSISLRRVKTDSLSPVLSANHSGWESAAFLSTLLTPPPGKDQRSGKAGSSGLLCPSRISCPSPETLLSITDADGMRGRDSNLAISTPSGNSSTATRGDSGASTSLR